MAKEMKHRCVFEEWDSKKKKMGTCGKDAKFQIGFRWVCQFHYEYARSILDIGGGGARGKVRA